MSEHEGDTHPARPRDKERERALYRTLPDPNTDDRYRYRYRYRRAWLPVPGISSVGAMLSTSNTSMTSPSRTSL